MNRLYLCCTKPDCKLFQRTVQMMKVWGLGDRPHADGRRWFFDVTVPEHWSARRRKRFAELLQGWPTKHGAR